MEVIPSIDILDGRVVRLLQGDFARVTTYGDPDTVLDALDVPRGSRLHLVDLENLVGDPMGIRIHRAGHAGVAAL